MIIYGYYVLHQIHSITLIRFLKEQIREILLIIVELGNPRKPTLRKQLISFRNQPLPGTMKSQHF